MDLATAIQTLNAALVTHQPKVLNPAWIRKQVHPVYRFVKRHIRTVDGRVDWDTVTRGLDREFQRRFIKQTLKTCEHDNRGHVDALLANFQHKLYVFLAPLNEEDKIIRDTISIALVRMAQHGNAAARQQIHELLMDTIHAWIEVDERLIRWRGYDELIPEQVDACIRRYRYSGSFIGYLYRTLELAGQGLHPLEAYSLDEELPSGKKRRIENVTQDDETGDFVIF